MDYVTLTGTGVGPREFELSDAQRLLDFQKKEPPQVWFLDDSDYELVEGCLTKKEVLDQE